MEWPFRRFVAAFDAFQRRTLCDEWKTRKALHLAALVSNTNLDDERNDRASIHEKLEKAYDATIVRIWNGPDEGAEAEVDAAWDSDFMKAGRKAITSISPLELPGESTIRNLPA